MNRFGAFGMMAAVAMAGALSVSPAPPSVEERRGREEPRRHVKHGKTYAPNGAREVARRLKRGGL